jgi:hypothetical protein
MSGHPKRKIRVRLLWEPRDLWVGVYWTVDREATYPRLRVYVCLLPTLPILVTIWPWRTTP